MSGLSSHDSVHGQGYQSASVPSLPGTPKLTPRRSIFSSEPRHTRSAIARISYREAMRQSPGTRRRNTPPTPRRAWSNKDRQSREELEGQEYETLAKLPLPPLADTMAQYLDNVRPLVTEAVYLQTKQNVEKFSQRDGVGEKAMLLLEERGERLDNWAYDYWLADMYLNVRLPLPVNSNPAMVLPKRKFSNSSQMLSYTARLVHGFLKFKSKLDRRTIPQDKAKAEPLCMAQYFRVLTTYRQPGREQDRQLSSGEESKEEEHIIVGRRGVWWSLRVKTRNKWAELEDIYGSLTELWHEADQESELGYLTSQDRRAWAEAHTKLEAASENNKNNLKVMADSLLFVCLDEETQNVTDSHRSLKDVYRQMMTGGGSRYNGANRWYDKTVQLIVSADGASGLCYEHSSSEGIVVISLLEEIIRDLDSRATQPIAYHNCTDPFSFKKLEWAVDEDLMGLVRAARSQLDSLDADTDLEVFSFSGYGKEFIKNARCSPDAWLQMSLQLTMFRLNGSLVPTYESASTRRFRFGRVDCIRAAHPEALSWCRSMSNDKLGREDKKKFFDSAIKKQVKVMQDNISGRGLDIPLLGLREGVKEAGLSEFQELFDHEAYSAINHFKLSTSQVPVALPMSFMGYGAVVPDGYGVSYNPYSDNIIFCIASFFSCPDTDSRRFASELQISLQEMKNLFVFTKC